MRAETIMHRHRAALRLISGVGKKGPACFAVEAHGKRLVLDLGEGPPPGLLPDIALAAPADALILSHGHKDHIGGLSLLARLGNPPVYATEIVAQSLPREIKARTLPIRGTTEVLGIAVETGRDGHAPGGVWLHFGIGDGFLYTGDYSAESALYVYDSPTRPAATALIDCSYGDYDRALAACWSELAAHLGKGPLLLPVPANGRGPEIALELMRHGFRGAAEIAATLEHMAAFAHLADVVPSHLFDLYYDATLGDDEIRAFLGRENPQALAAIEDCFRRLDEASLWVTRRNSILASLREAS